MNLKLKNIQKFYINCLSNIYVSKGIGYDCENKCKKNLLVLLQSSGSYEFLLLKCCAFLKNKIINNIY